MEKSARHLSTGEKITQAADDGSAYAISERMRAMIRGLRQANDNAKTATDLLKTAEDALHGTTGLLRRMKELAVQAANGIYSDADYRAMDDEYQQCKSQLDDIAALTNYNGIPLLDGSWESRIAGGVKPSPAAVPTELATYTQNGNTITITGDGVYTIPSNIAPGTIIKVKSQNVLINQASAQAVQNISIQCDPGTNLFIEDLNIKVDDSIGSNSIIDFQGTGNTLTLMGINNLKGEYSSPNYVIYTSSLIHVGMSTELTIQENGKGTINMGKNLIKAFHDDAGAVLGGNRGESCGKIIIDSGNIFVKNGIGSNGAGIGGGCSYGISNGSSVAGTIVINGGHIEAHAEDGAAIGAGCSDDNVNIVINGGTVEAYIDCPSGNTNMAAAIGSGCYASHATITINGGYVKGTTLPCRYDGLTRRPIGNGYQSTATLNTAPNISYHTEDIPNISNVDVYGAPPEPEPYGRIWNGLRFQPDTRAGFQLVCFINDMHSKAFGLSGTNLLTQDAAQSLLGDKGNRGIIDSALETVMKEVSRLGAYQSRLGYTQDNLTASHENVTDAESTIRDADMAKETAEYRKAHTLLQTSQSMQAKINEHIQSILKFVQ